MSAAAAAAAGRGPLNLLLQSAAGQWALVGAGGYYLVFPEHVRQGLANYGVNIAAASNSIAASRSASRSAAASMPQMITIQTPGMSTSSSSRPFAIMIYAIAGGAVCWLGYVACTQVDFVAQLLPVTKQVFEQATNALRRAIWNVKQALEEKILGVSKKQDELSAKQSLTHAQVLDLHRNLEDARGDLLDVRDSVERCEDSLEQARKLQSYTQRGVRLLIQCVTSFLPEDAVYRQDIQRFLQEQQQQQDEQSTGNSTAYPPLPAAAPSAQQPPIARAVSLPSRPSAAIGSIPEDECYQESVKTRAWYEETISFGSNNNNSSSSSDDDEDNTNDEPAYPLFSSPTLRTPPSPALTRSSSEPVRPRGTTAILYGQDSPAQVVDIQALLGH